MTVYCVGDIQGCYEPLMRLLDSVEFDPDKDELWSVGDLVNRGPESLAVLEYCMSLGQRFRTVLGNHDLHLMALIHLGTVPKRGDTLEAVLRSPERDAIFHWLRQKPLLFYDQGHDAAVVHAGIPPQWSLKKALKHADEVSDVLRDDDQIDLFLQTMYGNKPHRWRKGLEGETRWRVITNYFTRMRFCDAKGGLNLEVKTGLDEAPEGCLPWFDVPDRACRDTRIFFGHWAALMGQVQRHNIWALDTGCVWGQRLTLIDVDQPHCSYSVKAKKGKRC